MSPRVVSPIEQLEIVSLLAHGSRNFMSVSRKVGVPELLVMEVGQAHGWPDLGKLRDAAEAMRTGRSEIPHAQPAAVAPAAKQPPARTEVAPTPVAPVASAQPATPRLSELRERAKPFPVLSRKVERLVESFKSLSADVAAAEVEADKTAERSRERLERIAKLKRESAAASKKAAALRAELRKLSQQSTSAKAIRLWARENGVTCPERGIIPSAVREAWEKAQG